MTAARTRAAACALAMLIATFPPPAQAVGPVGLMCDMAHVTDHTREAGWRTAVVTAGPVVATEPGRLVCTVQVNSATHDGPDSASGEVVCFITPEGVVCIYLDMVFFPATAADTVSLCTSWVPDGGPTLYWAAGSTAGTGFWSTDPGTPCGEPISFDANPLACPALHSADYRVGTNLAEVWQDCEAYAPLI